MWKEGKKRRTIIGKMNNNLSMPTKRPDQDALKRFREVPYQLRYGKEKKDACLLYTSPSPRDRG